MKITYIKLVNFTGIYVGTGKTELEIDFSNNKNKIVMLLGGNGSGKTTLMSLLTPFRNTEDNRTDIIIKGQKGYKEVHFKNNKDNYIIKHFYGKNSSQNKSFIMKNDKELNDNGSIRNFNSILEIELGVNTDYLKIGRISSDLNSFISMPSAARKTYINNFIPSIDDYLDAYQNAKEKLTYQNKRLKTLTSSIDKFSTLESLNSQFNRLNENKEKLNDNKNEINSEIKLLNKEINLNKDKINSIGNTTNISISSINLNTINNYKEKIENNINKILKTSQSIGIKETEFNNLIKIIDDKIKAIENKIPVIDNQIINLNKNKKELTIKINDYNDKLNEKNDQINNLQNNLSNKNNYSTDSLTECKEHIKILEKTINATDNKIINNSNLFNNDIIKLNKENNLIENFNDSIESIIGNYTEDFIINTISINFNLTDLNNNNFKLKNKIEELNLELDSIKKKINII